MLCSPTVDKACVFDWDGRHPKVTVVPQERGFMDEPMASRINTVLELFSIFSFIFANRFPIYVDSASCTDA